ncbi:MAG: ethylbenzene dehydrogenase, partial [Chloroflexi bacterium]
YLDSTQWSADTPEAGRHSDPKDGGGYADNQTEDKKMPMWMGPADAPKDGAPGYILDDEKLPFDDSLFAAGDMIPSIVKSMLTGDRGNIAAGWVYADGKWTLEIGRALVTGSEFDVQFSDLTQPYYFGMAAFDNAQVRHAFMQRPGTLLFK